MSKVREVAWDPQVMSMLCSVDGHDEAEEVAEIVTLRQRLRELVRWCIDSLDEPYRSIIEARWYEQCTFEEMAARLGYEHRSTALRVHRDALGQLKSLLEGEGCLAMWNRYQSLISAPTTGRRSRG